MSGSQSLTRELILARSKTDNLKLLKNLNLWGVGFEDVSILNQMPNVEVLALSINKISSLKDFQNCHQLRELYVRQNNIRNLGEVKYLQKLPNLRTLWLSENPCADHPNYRQTVISMLPNLQKLDNKEITSSERNAAVNSGGGGGYMEEPQEQPRMSGGDARRAGGYSSSRNNLVPLERFEEPEDSPDEYEEDYSPPMHNNSQARNRNSGYQEQEERQYGSRSQYQQQPPRDLQRSGLQTPPNAYENRPPSRQMSGQSGPKINPYMKQQDPGMRRKERPEEVVGGHKTGSSSRLRHENVVAAVLSLLRDLDVGELEFIRREVNLKIDEAYDQGNADY